MTLFPPETAGHQVGRIYGRTCEYPSGFISWVYRGEYFSSSTRGKSEKSLLPGIVDGGIWTHDPKKTWSVDDAIC